MKKTIEIYSDGFVNSMDLGEKIVKALIKEGYLKDNGGFIFAENDFTLVVEAIEEL